MTVLETITLSNIRRFAENVIVPVSAQATILLAPNGTGKTALFEAIELALTGAVARLDSDLFPLVRDGKDHAEVNLDFGAFQHSAMVKTDGSPVQWSGPSALYGDVNAVDVPYLLRLTHLLDQRDRNWFIQEDSNNAGEQLSRLPAGKDTLHVSSLLTGLKTAVAKKAAEREIAAAKFSQDLRDWQELLRQRDEARNRVDGEVLGLSELALALQVHSAEVVSGDSIENLEAVQSVCASDNENRLSGLRRRSTELQQLVSVLANFSSASEAEGRLVRAKEQLDRDYVEAQASFNAAMVAQNDAIKAHREADTSLQEGKEALGKVESRDKIEREAQAQSAEFRNAQNAHVQSVLGLESAETALRVARDAEDANVRWNASRSEWVEVSNELEDASRMFDEWTLHVQKIASVEQRVATAEKLLAERNQALSDREAELTDAKRRAAEATSRLDVLRESSDRLRAAVAEIAANISDTREDCPVCGVVHGISELRIRIAAQLDTVEPSLRSVTEFEQACRDALATNLRQRDELSAQSEEVAAQVKTALIERDEVVKQIRTLRQHRIFGGEEIEGARNRLIFYRAEANQKKEVLDKTFDLLAQRPTAEVLVQLAQTYDIAKRREGESAGLLKKRETAVADSSDRLLVANHGVELLPSRESLLELVRAQSIGVAVRLALVRDAEAKAVLEDGRLKQLHTQVQTAEMVLSDAKRRVEECRKSWSAQQLPGDPDAITLNQSIGDLANAIAHAEVASTDLDRLRQKLARARGAVEYRLKEREVNTNRGDRGESEYGSFLERKCDEATLEKERVDERRQTLETFSQLLRSKAEEVSTRIAGIEPLWQSLLNRIVREPRFSQTGLQYLRRYNKPHAHVQVPISGRETAASKVASEAQKTDLQLSFLLSMAQAHTWSPWRALLLDDPVQHHDLVHASAVFDVLRDYIVEHKFQTIVTTHDPVQARFFARKLQNDGVDVQFLTLVPLDGGVKVQTLGSSH